MCKFDSENSSGFDLIVDAIQRYADESEATIKNHWATERKERQLYKELLAQGLFPTQTGSPPSESGSIFQYTPGKTQMALPASSEPSNAFGSYEIEEVEDKETVKR